MQQRDVEKSGVPEDWRPESLEKLNDGLRLMKGARDVGTGAAWECSPESLETMLAFSGGESADGCYAQETDGTARLSRAAYGLAEGTVGVVIDNGPFGGWYDGAYGLDLTEGQREGLMIFLTLLKCGRLHLRLRSLIHQNGLTAF